MFNSWQDLHCCVVGYGSIGRRHARILREMGCQVSIVSQQAITEMPVYRSIAERIKTDRCDYVVIANSTHQHLSTLLELQELGFEGKILVEKPVFSSPTDADLTGLNIYVGYNLRHHPLLQKLQERLSNERVVSASVYVGQYLPSWRPDADYRQSYSASAKKGGGVLRDLSHELDFVLWLFGSWQRLVARGGHYSPLEIDSDDQYAALVELQRCPLMTLNVNYLDRICQRHLTVHTESKTLRLDFIRGELSDGEEVLTGSWPRDFTYENMHRDVLGESGKLTASFAQGLDVVDLIAAFEISNGEGKWVSKI